MRLYEQRLWVYMMAALLPLVLFSVAMLWLVNAQQRNDLEATMREAGTSASHAVDSAVDANIAVLAALAASAAFQDENWPAFDHQVHPVAKNADWLSVVVTDDEKQLFNLHGIGPVLDAVGLAEALATGRPAVSNLIPPTDSVSEPAVVIRIPVLREGKPPRTLAAFLRASAFNRLLREHVPDEWISAVADRNGIIIARSRAAARFIGTPLAPSVFAAWQEGRDRVFSGVSKEGIESYGWISNAGAEGWVLAMGAPKALVDGHYRFIRYALWLGGGVAAVLTLLLTSTFLQVVARGRAADRARVAADGERRVHERLTTIAEDFPGVIFRRVRRLDGSVVYDYLSPGAARLGLDVGDMGYGLMVPEDRERCAAEIERSYREMRPYQILVRFRLADGSLRWMRSSAHPRRREDGTVVWDGVAIDVTEQQEAELALNDSRDRLSFALHAATAAMWDWEIVNNRIWWSPEFYQLYGLPADATPDYEAWMAQIHPEDRSSAHAYVAHLLHDRMPDFRFEFRICHPERGDRWILGLGRLAFAADGSPLRMSGINIDITERKEMEAAVQEAMREAQRANMAKSRFLAAASHDIRQPIQSLMLFAHALSARLKGHGAAPLVDKVAAALNALKLLLDSILDISKLDAGLVMPDRAVFEVSGFLARLAAEYQPRMAAKGLSFRVVDSAAWIDSDPTLLGRIVGNLLENALKYTAEGGVVLGCRRRGDRLAICVCDTGIGIAPAHQQAVFEEFMQIGQHGRDRAQGMGLGLATVKRMAALLGHTVGIRSRPGHGSAFWVEVPRAAVPAPAVAAPVAEAGPVRGRRVLVVDDEAAILEGMRVILEAVGHEVALASSAEEAVERVRMGFEPDVVVTDFRLPLGRNGSEVIHRVRDVCNRTIPSVVLTGDTEIVAAGLPSTALLHKPVNPRELEQMIGRLLRAA